MSVRVALLAVTPLAAETAACAAAGQDLPGMLNMAAEKVADAMQVVSAILDFIPSGTNKTTLTTQLATLT